MKPNDNFSLAAKVALLLFFIPVSAVSQSLPPQPAVLPAELSQPSPAVDRRVWNLVPIEIVLPVNKERLVTFTAPVQVEMPAKLDGQTLRTQIVADTHSGTIYWTALKPFERQRIQVQDLVSNAFYLVDLIATPQAQDTTRIEVAVPQASIQNGPAGPVAPVAAAPEALPEPDPVALTRMAAQYCYAPERLVQPLDGVSRASVSDGQTDDLLHGNTVQATPLMAWRSGDLVITAVKLKNSTASELVLDPRQLRGQWLTATFQHNLLKPAGQLRDTTAVYLISHETFDRSLHGY